MLIINDNCRLKNERSIALIINLFVRNPFNVVCKHSRAECVHMLNVLLDVIEYSNFHHLVGLSIC